VSLAPYIAGLACSLALLLGAAVAAYAFNPDREKQS
jgi:hypothetical protein